MKRLLFLMALLTVSCNSEKQIVEQTHAQRVSVDAPMLGNGDIKSVDSTKIVIVYNVIEKESAHSKVSDETLRLLIAEFFGTLSTIIAIFTVDGQ